MPDDQSSRPRKRRRPPLRRKTVRWSPREVEALLAGVRVHGVGKWAAILRHSRVFNGVRTSVDLKDKWRNLTSPMRAAAVAASNSSVPSSSESHAQAQIQPQAQVGGRVQVQAHGQFTSTAPTSPQSTHEPALLLRREILGGVPANSPLSHNHQSPGPGSPGLANSSPLLHSIANAPSESSVTPDLLSTAGNMSTRFTNANSSSNGNANSNPVRDPNPNPKSDLNFTFNMNSNRNRNDNAVAAAAVAAHSIPTLGTEIVKSSHGLLHNIKSEPVLSAPDVVRQDNSGAGKQQNEMASPSSFHPFLSSSTAAQSASQSVAQSVAQSMAQSVAQSASQSAVLVSFYQALASNPALARSMHISSPYGVPGSVYPTLFDDDDDDEDEVDELGEHEVSGGPNVQDSNHASMYGAPSQRMGQNSHASPSSAESERQFQVGNCIARGMTACGTPLFTSTGQTHFPFVHTSAAASAATATATGGTIGDISGNVGMPTQLATQVTSLPPGAPFPFGFPFPYIIPNHGNSGGLAIEARNVGVLANCNGNLGGMNINNNFEDEDEDGDEDGDKNEDDDGDEVEENEGEPVPPLNNADLDYLGLDDMGGQVGAGGGGVVDVVDEDDNDGEDDGNSRGSNVCSDVNFDLGDVDVDVDTPMAAPPDFIGGPLDEHG